MDNNQQIKLVANTIRILAAEAVEKAKSGHPGLPMGAADYAALLWSEYVRFDPESPMWLGRDRFILSAGHGCMLLYSLLHLFGYDLPLEQLKNFRQWQSKTPGHPEFGLTPGVETTTGPLGQGFANGVGIALSGKMLAERYASPLFDYRVFALVSDGDLMEGVAAEAASLAGHLALSNIVYIYDDNKISIGGSTDVCFSESVPDRFKAYGWFVQSVDGYDLDGMRKCLDKALSEEKRPSIICARSTIGFGSPHKAGDCEVHGAPLGAEELKATKQNLDWPADRDFFIPQEVKSYCAGRIHEKKNQHGEWENKFAEWSKANPDKAALWRQQSRRTLPGELKQKLIEAFQDGKKEASRSLSGRAIQVIAQSVPAFVGGSADLEPSTKTLIKASPDIQRGRFSGRNIRFGVREHAMGALVNGLAYCGCWFPYSATFLVFADYMRPTIRVAAISHLQSIFIFTHDSFWVGEDGPTHQPVEQIASLRLIPNLNVYRPADGLEVALCYSAALQRKDGPSVLLFTRQDLPALARPAGFNPDQILRGAYPLTADDEAQLVIVATGSEVWVALEASKLLAQKGINARVVSMPCVEDFLAQDAAYREKLLPPKTRKVSLEAGVTAGWDKVVGSAALKIGIDHFGASAPAGLLAEKYGFTPQAVGDKIEQWFTRE